MSHVGWPLLSASQSLLAVQKASAVRRRHLVSLRPNAFVEANPAAHEPESGCRGKLAAPAVHASRLDASLLPWGQFTTAAGIRRYVGELG